MPDFTVRYQAWTPVVPDVHYNTMSEAKDDALNMSNPVSQRLDALNYVTDRIMNCHPSSGVFDTIILPLLAFYLHPSKCPTIGDSPSLWKNQLDIVWSCLRSLGVLARGGNTDKMIVEGALRKWWPGLSKWMLYLFRRAIDDGNILEGKWKDVLVTALLFSNLSNKFDPRIADATWHRHTDVGFAFVQLSHSITAYVLATFSSDPPEGGDEFLAMVISSDIGRQIILSTGAASRLPGATSTLPKLLTSPSLGKSAIASLITAISIRPLPFTLLDRVLLSVHDAAGTLGNFFWLAEQRAVYWNMMALRAIVKYIPGSRTAPQTRDLMSRCATTALVYLHFALVYQSRDVIPDLVHLGIFRILVELAPLLDHPSNSSIFDIAELKTTIQRFISELTVFAGWKSIAQVVGPHIEALRVYEGANFVDGVDDYRGSFVELFSELHEASRSYGDRSRRICWNPTCRTATPEGLGQENGPLCRACSRCQSVTYCSVECQRVHWNLNHKIECRRIHDQEELYRSECRPGRELTMMKQPPPILLKQKMFMYHYVEQLLSKNLNLIYTHFVDPATGAYINVGDTVYVMFFVRTPVYFGKGPHQDSFWGYELSKVHRFVQFGVPWSMRSAFERDAGPPDMQLLFGTVELPAEGDVFEEGSVFKLGPTYSQYAGCPLGGWRITGE
ncbi:hypothetical protein CYLTODRAFT_494726, partial [Cylindrobasidium torrendii FP15055 ss-10]